MRIRTCGSSVILTAMAVTAAAQEKIGGEVVFAPIEHATMVIQAKGTVPGPDSATVEPVGGHVLLSFYLLAANSDSK